MATLWRCTARPDPWNPKAPWVFWGPQSQPVGTTDPGNHAEAIWMLVQHGDAPEFLGYADDPASFSSEREWVAWNRGQPMPRPKPYPWMIQHAEKREAPGRSPLSTADETGMQKRLPARHEQRLL